MPQPKRTDNEWECPQCYKLVKPVVLEDIPAMPNANPPIPFRQRVQCPAWDADNEACDFVWYVAP